MTQDFTLHFEIPDPPDLDAAVDAQAAERAFAEAQIRLLLEFVTLYADGKPVQVTGFSIVNAPGHIHPFDLLSGDGA